MADLNRNLLRLTSILAAILCTSCLSRSFNESDGFRGQVIDGVRQKPLAAATVRVWAEHNPKIQPQTVVADAEGRFAIQPIEWSTWVPFECLYAPCDPTPADLRLEVSAPGYRTYEAAAPRFDTPWLVVPLTPAD